MKQLNKVFTRKKNRRTETIEALRDISFSIERGEILGYLGVNGAGKSTTIKILAGIIKPTNGSATVSSIEPYKKIESLM